MCMPASFIVTRTKVLFLDWCDSHEEIIKHYKLDDSPRGGDFVRVEVTPKDINYRIPLKDWTYLVDQDTTPEWYDAREAEAAVRSKMKEWAKTHIIRRGKVVVPRTGNLSVIVLGGEAWVSGQDGGRCWALNGGAVHATGQAGGDCYALNGGAVHATGQAGGDCWAFNGGVVHATGQAGGDCWADDGGAVHATGQAGGRCYAFNGGAVHATGQAGGRCYALDGGAVHATGQDGGRCYALNGGKLINE